MSSESESTTTTDAGDATSDEERTQVTAEPTDDEDEEPVEIVHAPPRLSQGLAMGAALLGALLTTPFATFAIPFGVAGLVIVATSLFLTHSRGWLSLGTGSILMGAIITGAYGVMPPELMLVGVGATVLGWDAGQNGITIGEQLGRQTRSERAQLVHVALSAIAIGIISAIAYLVYLFAGGGRPAAAVAIVVLGIVITAWVLRS